MKLLMLCVCLWASSVAAVRASPILVVILLPGTSLHEWETADTPHLRYLRQTGAVGVMNTRTAHRPGQTGRETPASALLTLGAGSRAANTRQESVNLGYDLRPGNLAETLSAHGVQVTFGGGPNAGTVAADSAGEVRRVAVIQAAPGHCLVWDAGPDLAAADTLIGSAAIQAARLHGCLVVLSPYASQADYTGAVRLTPILLWGSGVPPGLLSSPSTHRAGLVTNTDFAPSVAASFGIPRTAFRPLPFGFAWSVTPQAGAVTAVARLSAEAVRQAHGMTALPYLALALGVWIAACTLWQRFRGTIAPVLGLVPVAAFFSALWAVSALSLGVLFCGVLAAILLLTRFASVRNLSAALSGVVVLTLLGDLLTGSRLMQRDLLGYSAIEGARYYGLGNEAMGLLLACALVVVCRLWESVLWLRRVAVSIMLLIVLLLGTAGAKAGGVLVSVIVFGTFLAAASKRRLSGKSMALIVAAALLALAATALGETFLPQGAQSHLGEAVRRIAVGGPGEATDIIRRKMGTEGRLLYHSAWAGLLWPALLCTALTWRRTPAAGPTESARRAAGVAGAMACLLLNDAGVVAAAIWTAALWSDTMAQKVRGRKKASRSL